MAEYKTHTKFNLFLALPILIVILHRFFYISNINLCVFSLSFAYSTLFMSPDMDLSHQIRLFSVRGFFSFPFRVYSRFFRHRGISHKPVLGSISRIVWLFGFLSLIFFLINLPFETKGLSGFFQKYQIQLFFGFIGITVADICHLILD